MRLSIAGGRWGPGDGPSMGHLVLPRGLNASQENKAASVWWIYLSDIYTF